MNRLSSSAVKLDAVAPSRAEVVRLVSEGSLADALRVDLGRNASPAHGLQQRLLEAYIAGTAPASHEVEARYPLAVRVALIVGITAALWTALAGGAMLVYAIL